MDISSLEEVTPWLRSFGKDVEVLAPPKLIQLLED
jgi:predicted DNA-binding transcriptional regulator YafY